MNYMLETYYCPCAGAIHEKIALERLHERIGPTLADKIIGETADRMLDTSIPNVVSFFENGGRQVVSAYLTSRGDVYIEAVEIPATAHERIGQPLGVLSGIGTIIKEELNSHD